MTKFTKSAAAAAAAILVSVTLAGCGGDEKTDITTVKVGVVGEYNAQWDTVNKLLEKDKIKVELVKYSDYATPNRALSDKEIDLNAFQHKAYLANDIKRNGYKIVACDAASRLQQQAEDQGDCRHQGRRQDCHSGGSDQRRPCAEAA